MQEEVTKEAGRQALIRADFQDVVNPRRVNLLKEETALIIKLTCKKPVLSESIFTGLKAHLLLIDSLLLTGVERCLLEK